MKKSSKIRQNYFYQVSNLEDNAKIFNNNYLKNQLIVSFYKISFLMKILVRNHLKRLNIIIIKQVGIKFMSNKIF